MAFLLPAMASADVAAPIFTSQPKSLTVAQYSNASLTAMASGTPAPAMAWQQNGVAVAGATGAVLTLSNVQPATAGIYRAVASSAGGSALSVPVVVGVTAGGKIAGAASEVNPNYLHPNGNTYDEMVLTGAAATVKADAGQITRLSWVDLNNDIVIAEFSGAGSLTVRLDNATGPAVAASYNQPSRSYMKGHASLVVAGANETTHVSVFSVGRANSVDQTIFLDDVVYDGVADIAFVAVASSDGKFGGLRTANTNYFAAAGVTGVFAPGVQFTGPVFVGDIEAHDVAIPALIVGSAADVRIVGGDLLQPNGRSVLVNGFEEPIFSASINSHGVTMPMQANQGQLVQDSGAAPTFTAHPAHATSTVGGSAAFTAAANDASTFQWQRNGVNVAGATSTTVTLSNVQPATAGIYRAVATNAAGSALSAPAILGVSTTSKVVGTGQEVGLNITHPNGSVLDYVLLTGAAATVTADAGQTTRIYYIDLNDDIVTVDFSGAGSLTLVLDDPTGPMAPAHYNQPGISYMKGRPGIIITGATESTNLSVSTVGRATAFDPTGAFNILLPVSPTNDPAANGSPLFQGHASTVYDGIADIAFIAISSPVAKFGALRAGNVRFSAANGLTGVFAPGVLFMESPRIHDIDATGTAIPALIFGYSIGVRVEGGDLFQSNGHPVLTSGQSWSLQFAHGSTSDGTILLQQTNQASLVAYEPAPPTIFQPLSDVTTGVGGTISMGVGVVGTAPFTYQWRKGGSPIDGATAAVLVLNNVQAGAAGDYDVVVTGPGGNASSNIATVTIDTSVVTLANPLGPALGSGHSVFDDQFLGSRFTVTAPFAVRSVEAVIQNSGGRDLFLAITRLPDASAFPTASSIVGLSDLSEVVFSTLFNPGITDGGVEQVSIPADVTLNPGAYAVVFGAGLFGSPPNASGGMQNYALITGSDTIAWVAPSTAWSEAQYDIIAQGTPTYGISMTGTVVSSVPPAITTQPVSQSVNAGSSVSFTVAATGTPAPTYQWRKDGQPLAGPSASTATLTRNNVQPDNAGTYDVIVTNSAGTVTSDAVTLTVNVPAVAPTIDVQPVSTFVISGQTATLSVVASGASPLTYQWYQGTSPSTASPIDGATTASFTTPALTATAAYWVRVANSAGSADSSTATVTVGSFTPTVALSSESGDKYSTAGGVATLRVRVTYTGQSPTAIGASVALPAGWSFGSYSGPSAVVTPLAGDTALEWAFASSPANELTFTFTVNYPAGQSGIKNIGGSVDYRLPVTNEPFAALAFSPVVPPTIDTHPTSKAIGVGAGVVFTVVADGGGSLTYQWRKGNTPVTNGGRISGAATATLAISEIELTDAGEYSVIVSNEGGSATSNAAVLAVVDAHASHSIAGSGYLPGGTVTITNTLTYAGALTALGWSVLPPPGWSYASDGGSEGEVEPTEGDTSLLEWAWTAIPASPVTFTYNLKVPADVTGSQTLSALVLPRQAGTQFQVLVEPDPLTMEQITHHSADTNFDFKLSLAELLRVIELYNTRNGTVRTGAYAVDVNNEEDGFTTDVSRSNDAVVALARYHSADSTRDGKLSLSELLRVIELYNYRDGTVRTGEYHIQSGSEDGYAAGP